MGTAELVQFSSRVVFCFHSTKIYNNISELIGFLKIYIFTDFFNT